MPLRNELKNFFKVNLSLINGIKTLTYFTKRYLKGIRLKFTTAKIYYPQYVAYHLKSIINKKSQGIKDSNINIKSSLIHYDTISKQDIWLVSDWYSISQDNLWRSKNDDMEIIYALHRWNWLIYDLSKRRPTMNLQKGLDAMRYWNSKINKTNKQIADISYNISERIANGIIFIIQSSKNKIIVNQLPNDITTMIRKMAFELLTKLEFHGEMTGNHILNNGRALYLYGQIFKSSKFIDLALDIFKNELPILTTEDGYLREGSSHYQFLVTRWLKEILIIASMHNNEEVFSLVNGYYSRMVRKCEFFIVHSRKNNNLNIPLIGDISPDYYPEWLIEMPFLKSQSSYEYSWNNIWQQKDETKNNPYFNNDYTSTNQIYKRSGWYRFEIGQAILFIHVDPLINKIYSNHAHSDAFSFVLYVSGVPILIDTGRLNYNELDTISIMASEARGHNSFTVDSLDPILHTKKHFFPDYYRLSNVAISYETLPDNISIRIKSDGLRRIWCDNIHNERIYELSKNTLSITDKFQGKKKHDLAWYFHFAPETKAQYCDNTYQFMNDNIRGDVSWEYPAGVIPKSEIHFGENNNYINGMSVEMYGKCRDNFSIINKCSIKFPSTVKHKFNWEE